MSLVKGVQEQVLQGVTAGHPLNYFCSGPSSFLVPGPYLEVQTDLMTSLPKNLLSLLPYRMNEKFIIRSL